MAKKNLRDRSSIPLELQWDLTLLYQDENAWEKDFAALSCDLRKFLAFRGRLGDSAATLRDAIAALDDLERRLEKLFTYSHLKHDEDTTVGANRARESRVRTEAAKITAACAWFDPEIMAIPDPRMEQLLAAPELAFYRRSLRELLREKPHTLSEPEERLLGRLSDLLGSASESFEALNDADLQFRPVPDGKGGKLELTQGSYVKLLENPDRRIRKAAFKNLYAAYAGMENTFTTTLEGTVKLHVRSAEIRHYPSALAQALFDNELPESIYTNLIDAVHAALPSLYRYLEIRRRALKLPKLDVYDLFCPILPEYPRVYSWEEAKSIVLEALSVMGPEYVATVQRAFDERWVDVLECRGKRSGAYSSGCYDSVPYLLLNFQGTLDSVFTLAHELGHSMHSFYSNRTQAYHYAGYEIFVAEVASITNELLLHDHLLKQSAGDPALRTSLLAHMANEIRTTLFRQTMFAEYELWLHRECEAGRPFTAEKLNDEYYRLNALYHGPKVHADPMIAHEWSRIPHFYYDFYVYQYATGMAAALKLSRNLLSGDPELKKRYFGFLQAGDSLNVLEILRNAGVDLGDAKTVRDALQEFESIVDQLDSAL